MFLEISQNSQENTCGKVSFLMKLQAEATASDLSRVFSWRLQGFLLISFQQKNEMKKGKYPDGVQIFTFLLEYRFVWRQRFQKKFNRSQFDQRMCLKGIWCCSFNGYRNFAMEMFLGGEHLTSSRTKTAESINFKLCTHISNRLLHKIVPAFFIMMSYSFFIAITQRALKAYFVWKQLKVDYWKNIWREENRGHGFACVLVGYISVKRNNWKLQFCCCGSSEYRKSN